MKREKMAYRLKKELDAARYAHTLGVEKTAREMAEKFGVDEEKAALAGLLHDCAKCMPLSQMTKAAKNEKLDPVMKESKALMHAVAGAHVADRHGHAAVRRFEPDLVHLQRHRPGKVGDGLFVRPFVEQLADAEQEDDRTCRFKVSAQDRYGNGCRVEHRHFDLPVQQTADAVAQETERSRAMARAG